MKLNIHLLLCSKRHYIDEIEYPPSPICGEKPQFESNVTSFQFRQNASARWWPIGHHLASAFWRGWAISLLPLFVICKWIYALRDSLVELMKIFFNGRQVNIICHWLRGRREKNIQLVQKKYLYSRYLNWVFISVLKMKKSILKKL